MQIICQVKNNSVGRIDQQAQKVSVSNGIASHDHYHSLNSSLLQFFNGFSHFEHYSLDCKSQKVALYCIGSEFNKAC